MVLNEHGCFVEEQLVDLHGVAQHDMYGIEIFVIGQIVIDVFGIADLGLYAGQHLLGGYISLHRDGETFVDFYFGTKASGNAREVGLVVQDDILDIPGRIELVQV